LLLTQFLPSHALCYDRISFITPKSSGVPCNTPSCITASWVAIFAAAMRFCIRQPLRFRFFILEAGLFVLFFFAHKKLHPNLLKYLAWNGISINIFVRCVFGMRFGRLSVCGSGNEETMREQGAFSKHAAFWIIRRAWANAGKQFPLYNHAPGFGRRACRRVSGVTFFPCVALFLA
jgi:hypothetical protein